MLVFRAGGHLGKTMIIKWDEFKGENPTQTNNKCQRLKEDGKEEQLNLTKDGKGGYMKTQRGAGVDG